MNRTQRVIKRQYREGETVCKKQKNECLEKRRFSFPGGFIDRKTNTNESVKKLAKEEKETRGVRIDFVKRVLSEKTAKEFVGV